MKISRLLAAAASVGVLDGAFAILLCAARVKGCTPVRVFQSIASGLLGRAAFDGGLATAALGVALHFTVAVAWATMYFLAYRRSNGLRRMVRSPYGTATVALVLGVVVWLVMDLVVVPLSGARPTPVTSPAFLIILLGHPVVVGLPIALIVRSREAD